MKATVDRLVAEKDSITGVVITSGKKTFFAGGDLKNMIKVGPERRRARSTTTASRSRQTCVASKLSASRSSPPSTVRRSAAASRSLSRPTTASRRTSRASRSACPRSPSACCPAAAASPAPCGCSACRTRSWASCSRGSSVRPVKAKEDRPRSTRSSASVEELVPAAKAWIKANPEGGVQPWDVKGYKIPGGTPSTPAFAANLPAFPANLRKQIKGAPMPAPRAIMAAAVEGSQVDFDNALHHRGALLHLAGHRPRREEHDSGVLLRPAGDQRRRVPSRQASRRPPSRRSACSARA